MNNRREHILACVTGQRNCERLIRQSAAFAGTLACPVSVLHVADGKHSFMDRENESAALEYLFQISKQYDAEMTVIMNENVVGTIVSFAHKNNITHIVLGVSLLSTAAADITKELKSKLPGVEFHIIPYDAASASGM